MAAQVQHLMASLHDIEALATAVKADAAQSCKASLLAISHIVAKVWRPATEHARKNAFQHPL